MVRLEIDTKELLTIVEAQGRLQIGYATIYRWIKKGDIAVVKIGKHQYIPTSEIERLNNANRKELENRK